ncbi:MAG: glycosyltransferase family 2 protein [Capsulimonadales bacterium]|nr:glycosyltransferase family 2 protein [Capsulimonadales bacterium]
MDTGNDRKEVRWQPGECACGTADLPPASLRRYSITGAPTGRKRNEMSLHPCVSVIIPAYNHADFVLRSLRSVANQTFRDFEVIVVNDGSPDRTHELCMPLADAGSIRYFRQENSGQASARNRGIDAARGRFIALLDDDDLWPADKLERQVGVLESDPAASMVYGRVSLIGPDDAPLSPREAANGRISTPPDGPEGDCFEAFARRNYLLSPGQALIRRSALGKLDEPPFDTDLWGVDDFDLWLRLVRVGPFRFQPTVSLLYRVHEGNASGSEGRMHRNEMALYRKVLARTPPNTPEYIAVLDGGRERYATLRRYWLASAVRSLQKGRWQDAGRRLATFRQLRRPF